MTAIIFWDVTNIRPVDVSHWLHLPVDSRPAPREQRARWNCVGLQDITSVAGWFEVQIKTRDLTYLAFLRFWIYVSEWTRSTGLVCSPVKHYLLASELTGPFSSSSFQPGTSNWSHCFLNTYARLATGWYPVQRVLPTVLGLRI
jgi:hypothetical protein